MNHDINFAGQKLGALVDRSVDPKTIEWIDSLAGETLIRQATIVPPADDSSLRNIANQLLTGGFDAVIFLTAAGVFRFCERSFLIVDRSRVVDALCDIPTIAIGKLASEKLAAYGVRATFAMPDCESWRDVLIGLEKKLQLANMCIALEQTSDIYGLAAGLEARGATVQRIDAVDFQQTDPSSAEQDLLDAIEDGELGAMLLPNPVCAARFAFLIDRREQPILKKHLKQLVILALNRETEELLTDRGFPSDIVLQQP